MEYKLSPRKKHFASTLGLHLLANCCIVRIVGDLSGLMVAIAKRCCFQQIAFPETS
jgi:hypothetical protein